MLHLPDLNYDCVGCGFGCQAFEVEVYPNEVPHLQALNVTAERRRQGFEPLRVTPEGRSFLTKPGPQGQCVFLTSDNRCQIHAQHGYDHKPHTCRDFPFQAQPTPGGVYIGLSFSCTAVTQNLGRACEAHREALESRYPLPDPTDSSGLLWAGDERLAWSDYLIWESELRAALLANPGNGLLRSGWMALHRGCDPLPPVSEAYARECDRQFHAFITLLETAGHDSSLVSETLLALHEGQRYRSLLLDTELDLRRVAEGMASSPDWFVDMQTRYLEHVLFRKFLLGGPDLLTRALVLGFVPMLLNFFTHTRSLARGAAEPEFSDCQAALRILEGRMLFHTRGLEDYYGRVRDGLARHREM